jgi:murein L,D-transpeptidase YafK
MIISALLIDSISLDTEVNAKNRCGPELRNILESRKLKYPPSKLLFRSFKKEKELEIWASNGSKSKLKLLKIYPVLAASGGAGPKRKEGDKQVPEGLYHIDRFNPKSRFHLSLRINYPNASDRVFADPDRPGGDIFIHGSNKSIGCLAMGDPAIEEIYTLARACPSKIPVLILNARKVDEKTDLGKQLAKINRQFEKTHFVPRVRIDQDGNYVMD